MFRDAKSVVDLELQVLTSRQFFFFCDNRIESNQARDVVMGFGGVGALALPPFSYSLVFWWFSFRH
jgi:hypothetical protein